MNDVFFLTGSFALGLTCTAIARSVALRVGFLDPLERPRKIHRDHDPVNFQFEIRSDRFWVGVSLQRLSVGRQVVVNPFPCMSFVWSW